MDDEGRNDLCGGLGYVLLGGVVFWGGLAGWLLWRAM